MKLRDLRNQRFGKLLVIARAPNRERGNDRSDVCWECLCDCGKPCVVSAYHLLRGNWNSCGCQRGVVHGHARRGNKRTEYIIWCSMHKRCFNPNCPSYPRYGGRGITVCDEWSSFACFLSDMGSRPEGHCLDRIDNDKGYSKDNCRWASYQLSGENKRSTRYLTFRGETKSIAGWSRVLGIDHAALRHRLKNWTIEEALTIPKLR